MENQTIILVGLFVCHWIGDYTHLSTAKMLTSKRLAQPLSPILAHAGVHAFLMSVFLYLINTVIADIFLLGLFQLLTHFSIDVWKGKMNKWFPSLQNPANKWHWIVFGFDQLLHALVIIAMSCYF